jgi:hypothetical protein
MRILVMFIVSSSEDQELSDGSEDDADGEADVSCSDIETEVSDFLVFESKSELLSSRDCEAIVSCFVGCFSGFLGG